MVTLLQPRNCPPDGTPWLAAWITLRQTGRGFPKACGEHTMDACNKPQGGTQSRNCDFCMPVLLQPDKNVDIEELNKLYYINAI